MSRSLSEKDFVGWREKPPLVPDSVYNRAVRILIRFVLEEERDKIGKKKLQRVVKGLGKVAGDSK